MGVCSVYCPDGLTMGAWEQGLRMFAQHKAKKGSGGGSGSRS
jgi:hypothetical protein